MHELTVTWEAIPRTVERLFSMVTNPDPLSPGHSEAVLAGIKIFGA
jgi:hypothetical protein